MIGSLSNDDGDGKEKGKIFSRFGLALKFVRASRFFVHFIPMLYDYDENIPIFTFYEVKQKKMIFFLQLRPSSYVVLWPCRT